MPLVAAWAHPMIIAAFNQWWAKWRRKAPAGDPIRGELSRIADLEGAGPQEPAEVSAELEQWLHEVGGSGPVTPGDARRWLAVWDTISRRARDARLPTREAGPIIERPPLPRAQQAGRAVRSRRQQGGRIERDDGTIATQPREVARLLIETREDIWFLPPNVTYERDETLEAYSQERSHRVPEEPPTDYGFLRGTVLAPAGSGVGGDGAPYEVYQLHPQLTACILAQAFFVAQAVGVQAMSQEGHDPNDPAGNLLSCVLGPATELCIWIPKIIGNLVRWSQRPLSLPTCMRRLFGGASMRVIGPGVEPALEPAQAAVAGGSCARSIHQAMNHLHDEGEDVDADEVRGDGRRQHLPH